MDTHIDTKYDTRTDTYVTIMKLTILLLYKKILIFPRLQFTLFIITTLYIILPLLDRYDNHFENNEVNNPTLLSKQFFSIFRLLYHVSILIGKSKLLILQTMIILSFINY